MATPRSTYLFLAVAVLAASQSGNLVRLGEAPAIIIAGWRLLLAALVLAPWGVPGLLRAKPSKRDVALLLLTGGFLSLHFLTWIAGVQRTTVANAALVFSIHPVFTALGGILFLKERLDLKVVVSIALGLVGVAVLGLGDLRLNPDNLLGDGLAILSALLFTSYLLMGRFLRQSFDSTTYVFAIYGSAAVVSFGVATSQGLPLVDYSARTWLCFALMAAIPTLVGHTGFNHAVKYLAAAKISVVSLSEPLFAALVATAVWGEPITLVAVVGYGLIMGAVVVLVLGRVKRVTSGEAAEASS